MKRLFDENDRYVPLALTLESRCNFALNGMVKDYIEDGYSLRDINLILHYAVDNLMLQELMKK
jgi:hypothetical protein